jgi:hypothetical protein
MARLAARALSAGLALLALAPAGAAAQGYPVLHVVALAQHADRLTVEPSGIFHVTIHVRITQRRDRLDELILGSFSDCEIISNETVRTALPAGTDFVERLTIQALAPGEATISPAYIDAIDPRLGRPMRYSSNAVRVRVAGGLPVQLDLHGWGENVRRLLVAVAIVASLFAAVFVVAVVFVRRRRRPQPAAERVAMPLAPRPPSPPPVPEGPARLEAALERFRRERSVAALVALRAELFAVAGARAGATLVDALRASGGRDDALRAALLAAEAALFGPAAEREAAGDALLAALSVSTPRPRASEDVWIR